MNNSSTDDFPKCLQLASAVIASFISFLSIVSFVGNSIIIITFLKTLTLRTSVNYLIVNMAISDVISAATNWPLASTEGMLPTLPEWPADRQLPLCVRLDNTQGPLVKLSQWKVYCWSLWKDISQFYDHFSLFWLRDDYELPSCL